MASKSLDWLKNLELYRPWKNLLHVLDLCRFSVLMVVAGGLLLYSAQGQDMLLGIAGAPFCPDWVVFLFVLTIWASSAGFFARIILSFDFRRKMAPQDPLEVKNKTESAPHWSLDSFRREIPWVLLVLAFWITGWNLFEARLGIDRHLRSRVFWLASIPVVFGIVVVLFRLVWVRCNGRKYLPYCAQRLVPEPRKTDDLIPSRYELIGNGCNLRVEVASDGNPEDEIIRQFKEEFESKKKECAVLIVRTTDPSEKWTLAGFDDTGKFRTVVIDDPNDELSKELKKELIDKSRISELATSKLGRTLKLGRILGNKWICFSILILFFGLLGLWLAPSLVKKFFFVFPILAIIIMLIIFLRSFHKLMPSDKLSIGKRSIIYAWISAAVILCILSTFDPLLVSNYVVFHNPIALFMIWAATTTAFGSGIVYWSNHRGAPILTLLFIWAVSISYINDNHNLRQVEEGLPQAEEAKRVYARPTVAKAAKAWLETEWSRLVAQKQVDDPPLPVVVVATAGGGIRAAYWTVTVLGRLNQIGGFDRHLFAISGVSGGSVGAAVYRAVLADLERGQRPSCANVKDVNHAIEPCAQKVLEGDLLVPIIAGTLYPDLIQRFWPFGEWSHGLSFPDRQSALEKGFEAAYKEAMDSDRFAQSLLTLYAKQQQDGKESWPALLLNATWVSMGRRIVASNLDLSNANAASNNLITVYDQLGCIDRDLRLSTAAGNSARFPGLSPAGTLRVPKDGPNCWLTADQETPLKPGNVFGHLLDGGYFENFGAKTAQEVLSVLIDEARKSTIHIRPIVIQISSDPSLPDNFDRIADPDPVSFGYEIQQPFLAAFATRSAHGILAAKELQQYTESLGQGECALRLEDASDGNPEDEIIRQFKEEFESKKKECAVLIVRATNQPEKWTLAGFDDTGEFCKVPINDPNHDLPKELKKKPINKSRIIELATSRLGHTPIDCNQDRGIFLHFNMIHDEDVVDPPLGWMLSDVAQLRIKSYLDEGYDLHLMSVATADDLVNEGRNLVIVALVGTHLHIRIFDANGNRVVDKAENQLIGGEKLTTLKNQLNPLSDECSLSPEQKQKIIRDAISIAGYNLAEDGSMREQLKAYDSKFEEWFKTDRYRKGYERNLNNLRIIEKVFACYKTVKK